MPSVTLYLTFLSFILIDYFLSYFSLDSSRDCSFNHFIAIHIAFSLHILTTCLLSTIQSKKPCFQDGLYPSLFKQLELAITTTSCSPNGSIGCLYVYQSISSLWFTIIFFTIYFYILFRA